MNGLRKLFSVLFTSRRTIEFDDPDLTARFEAAKDRLHNAQSDFARVITEVLDQNERLRTRNGPHGTHPRARP